MESVSTYNQCVLPKLQLFSDYFSLYFYLMKCPLMLMNALTLKESRTQWLDCTPGGQWDSNGFYSYYYTRSCQLSLQEGLFDYSCYTVISSKVSESQGWVTQLGGNCPFLYVTSRFKRLTLLQRRAFFCIRPQVKWTCSNMFSIEPRLNIGGDH